MTNISELILMKDHIFELRSWNEDLNDNRSIMHNLKSYELSLSLEKNSGLSGIRTHDLYDIPVHCNSDTKTRHWSRISSEPFIAGFHVT